MCVAVATGLFDGVDFEDDIFNLGANHRRTHRLEEFAIQARELILPFSVLKGGQGGYLEWMLRVAQLAPTGHVNLLAQPEKLSIL